MLKSGTPLAKVSESTRHDGRMPVSRQVDALYEEKNLLALEKKIFRDQIV